MKSPVTLRRDGRELSVSVGEKEVRVRPPDVPSAVTAGGAAVTATGASLAVGGGAAPAVWAAVAVGAAGVEYLWWHWMMARGLAAGGSRAGAGRPAGETARTPGEDE